jgi:hypothetical protein
MVETGPRNGMAIGSRLSRRTPRYATAASQPQTACNCRPWGTLIRVSLHEGPDVLGSRIAGSSKPIAGRLPDSGAASVPTPSLKSFVLTFSFWPGNRAPVKAAHTARSDNL